MKTLISAQTVRDAKASGKICLFAGKDVLVTPEARSVAEQLGVRLDDGTSAPASPAETPACAVTSSPESDAIRQAVIAKLPAEVASKPEIVDQIVARICQAQQNGAPAQSAPTATAAGEGKGIKLVKGDDVHLGVFPGAGEDKQVGIADVITAADGAPIAAGFMAWSNCFFPWTLDYDEIDLVLEGELHIRHNGQTYVGKAGDVLYIPKGSAIEFGTTSRVRFFYVTYPANWQG
jgi:ethanolamine utilization protein EutQ